MIVSMLYSSQCLHVVSPSGVSFSPPELLYESFHDGFLSLRQDWICWICWIWICSLVHNVLPFTFLQRETAGTLCSTLRHVDLKPRLKQASWHKHNIWYIFYTNKMLAHFNTWLTCMAFHVPFMLWNYMNPNYVWYAWIIIHSFILSFIVIYVILSCTNHNR